MSDNIYGMFVSLGRVGFFVKRNSWSHPHTVARVISVAGLEAPPLDGKPPYYGNPEVMAEVSYQGEPPVLEGLRCPNTFAYRLVDRPIWWPDDKAW